MKLFNLFSSFRLSTFLVSCSTFEFLRSGINFFERRIFYPLLRVDKYCFISDKNFKFQISKTFVANFETRAPSLRRRVKAKGHGEAEAAVEAKGEAEAAVEVRATLSVLIVFALSLLTLVLGRECQWSERNTFIRCLQQLSRAEGERGEAFCLGTALDPCSGVSS